MADWIPFHRRLVRGPKRGVPRAHRFVLLELALESRETRGTVDLPPNLDTVDALHDLLGGNRDEIAGAIEAFGGDAVIVERGPGYHRVVIPKWEDWAAPKSSTERSQERRDRQRSATLPALHRVAPATLPALHDHATATPTVQDSTDKTDSTESAREARSNPTAHALTASDLRRDASVEAIAGAIRDAGLETAETDAIAAVIAGRGMASGKRLEWILAAIADCGAHFAGSGLQAAEARRKLVTYADHARAPKDAPTGNVVPAIAMSEIDRINAEERMRRKAEERAREAGAS